MEKKKKRRASKYIAYLLLGALISIVMVTAIAVGASYVQNRNFKETFYNVTSVKVDESIRIVQLSDLHTVEYDHLVRRIQLLEPDLIVLTGDIVDHKTVDESKVIEMCGQLAQIAPSYYVYGNHERLRQYGSELMREDVRALAEEKAISEEEVDFYTLVDDELREQIEAAGVDVLFNEQVSIQIGGTTMDIYGVLTNSFEGFYEYAEDSFYQYAYTDQEHFKLMLMHEPYLLEWIAAEQWGDLILCGHTHGGIMRLPYVGGLYENLYGFLPEFLNDGKIKGMYSAHGIPVVVSGGLENNSIWRVNNQPELVIIDIDHN